MPLGDNTLRWEGVCVIKMYFTIMPACPLKLFQKIFEKIVGKNRKEYVSSSSLPLPYVRSVVASVLFLSFLRLSAFPLGKIRSRKGKKVCERNDGRSFICSRKHHNHLIHFHRVGGEEELVNIRCLYLCALVSGPVSERNAGISLQWGEVTGVRA